MHQLPDDCLADLLPVAKKIALAIGCENYNILQNNGKLAHQIGKNILMQSIMFTFILCNLMLITAQRMNLVD
jgi:hypothetical protein